VLITRSRSRRVAMAVTLAFALSGATACGSDDGGSDDAGSETTTTAAATDAEASGDEPEPETETEPTGDEDPDAPPAEAGDADRQDYIDALAAAAGNDDFADPDQSECLAEGWIDAIGADELRDAGITPEQFADGGDEELQALGLDEDTADEMYDQFAACDLDLRELIIGSSQAESGLTPDQQSCVEDTLTDEALRAWFVADLLGGEDVEDPFEALAVCFS
jgi:hypothetical protein